MKLIMIIPKLNGITSFITLLLVSFIGKCAINYNFSSSSGAFTPNSAPTTIHNTAVDEALSPAINIGFTFNFGGCTTSPYTQVKVSSNGWLSLGTGATGAQSTNDMAWSNYGPLLAPLWDDLKTSATGKVDYQLTGAAGSRVFTVEWLNMLWSWSAGSTCVSFQVKLYEANGQIEYIYRQEAGTVNNSSGGACIGINGGVAGDYYSLNGTGVAPNAIYGTATNNLSTRPATGQIYTWALPGTMVYASSTVNQASTANVYQGSSNQEIIAIPITVSGGCTPFSLTQLIINMNGTTAISDVTNIDVYYTGTSSVYSSSTLFGSVTPASGNLTVNGTQVLQNGTNYFWIVYDISTSASIGNQLDAQCTQITMSGGVGSVIPSSTDPLGSRPIILTPGSFAKWIELGWARSVIESSDGDIIWVGLTSNTYSSGSSDFYVVKTSQDLNTIYWSYVGGTAASSEQIERVVETADGFVLLGWSNMADGAAGYNIMLTKINFSGIFQWTKTIGTAGTDYGYGVCNTTDGNIAICGPIGAGSPNDGYFAKIDNATGSILTEKTISAATGVVLFRDIIQTSDGGYLLGGKANNDFYLVKLTSTFSIDWSRRWGGANNDEITFVIENGANDYTVGGTSYSFGSGSSDGYMMRFTWTAGAPSVVWVKAYGTVDGNQFTDGQKTSDGGYIMSGITTRTGDPTNNEAWVVKVNSSGNNVFMKSIGTSLAGDDEEGYGVCQLSDGSYAIAGLHNPGPHFYMMKMSGDGYNCSVIQDNGTVLNLTTPAFTSDGSLSALTTTIAAPVHLTNTGGIITGGCLTSTPVILPIELIKFDGYSQNAVNILTWTTATEINNDYFVVEHSSDAVNWNDIGSVQAAGNTNNVKDYSLIDAAPFSSITYYRLKQVDFNGQYQYSNVISISRSENFNSNYMIYPNPTRDVLYVRNSGRIPKNTYLEIYNTIGQKVFLKELDSDTVSQSIILKEILSQGLYFISIYENSNKVYTEKIIIQ